MKEIKYIIKDELGLHARPAGQLVKIATQFDSSVEIGTKDKLVNAKSILGIMSLGIKTGEELIIKIDGADEDKAIETFNTFLNENL